MITVLCCGVFDIYHIGHLNHLRAAARYGDVLVVAITMDEFVGKGPGRPLFTQQQRAEVIASLSVVDQTIFSKSGADAILKVRPQVYAKGCDRAYETLMDEEKAALKHVGATAVFTKTEKLSSTEILNKLIKGT